MSGDDAWLGEALGMLRGEGRRRGPDELRAALRDRFRAGGEQRLADLVYEMLKACLAEVPDVTERIAMAAAPRRAEVIWDDVDTMRRGMDGLPGGAPDVSPVTRATPPRDAALDDVGRCLDVLTSLEGRTVRRQLAAGLHLAYAGRLAEADDVLRDLHERDDLDDRAAFYAAWNLSFVLITRDRDTDALPVAEAALALDPEHPGPYMNIATAAARLGDAPRFRWAMDELAALQRRDPATFTRRWWRTFTEVHAGLLGLARTEVDALLDTIDGDDDER